MTEQKVRIKIKSFDHRLADQAVRQIVDAIERTGAIVAGPVPLPTRIEKFCVIRGPNIDKDSREQFEIRTHKRVIDVLQPSSKTIDALSQLDLASGVEIDIKL
jgi:small subunit ribosomal protein S10